ncbi:MAG: toxin-antitoxin system YwqK family antitoxin [Prosthecobacter sp.]
MKPLVTVLFFALRALSLGQEEIALTKEIMIEGTRANLAAYDKIKPSASDAPVTVRVKLGESVSMYRDKLTFDGFRITAPDDLAGRDFVWYHNAPDSWGTWYIVPVAGEVDDGFRNWLRADKVYEDLDKAGEKGRARRLQTLDGSYFKPGADYILWFQHTDVGGPDELRAVFHFAPKPKDEKDWDHESLEKALKLKAAPPAEQVKQLASKGGEILLDSAFFTPDYGTSRINDVFFNLRQTQRMSGGYFITMEVACPPCRTRPSLVKIREKHGAADFVQTAAEAGRTTRRKRDADEDKDEQVTTHYYDYFAFEVAADDPEEKVLRVRTHASDFSKLRPPAKGGFFGQVDLKNLTVLHQDGKEVGRLYYFMEGGKEPLCIQEPPPGKYQNDDLTLEYQGGGNWQLLTHQDGKLTRRIPFVGHRMEGLGEGFYPSGRPSFKASYKAGVFHGEVVEYSEKGDVIQRERFNHGEGVSDEDKNMPRKGPVKAGDEKPRPKAL